SHSLGQCRGVLAEWVAQYPLSLPDHPREAVLDRVLATLRAGDAVVPACQVLVSIGYRRADIPPVLWNLVEREPGHTGNVLLASLAALGVPLADRARLEHAVRQRAT